MLAALCIEARAERLANTAQSAEAEQFTETARLAEAEQFTRAGQFVEAQQPSGAHFNFDKVEHNFGDIPHSSDRVEYRFEFTNDGTAPLVITRTLTSCNCTKVEYDRRPVPPGGRGAITVIYEANKKEAGVFYKTIEIYSNSPERRNNLIIKGNAVE